MMLQGQDYYCQVDPGFIANQLEFSNLSKALEEYEDHYHQNYVDIQDGTSIVFRNCPHRLLQARNETEKVLQRTILSFFIVDQNKPLKDTKYIENLKENIIKEYGEEQLEQKLREEGIETDIKIGKKKRAEVRKQASEEVTGWGYIHYGNDGEILYLDSFQAKANYPTPFKWVHLY